MSALEEIWKDIKGFEGFYQVSTLGRIKRLPSGNRAERIRVQRAAPNGYMYVVLSTYNKHKTIRVHRAVAEAFIPNPNNLNSVNHKNLVKSDNNVENLEWMDIADNARHAVKNGKGNQRAVRQLTMDGEFVKDWQNISEANRNGFIGTLISRCCRGKNSHHRGFKWMYL